MRGNKEVLNGREGHFPSIVGREYSWSYLMISAFVFLSSGALQLL